MKHQTKIYLIFALLTSFAGQAQNTENTISVRGVGEVTIENTQGQISASVTTQDMDADQALQLNNNRMNQIISELNAVGISGTDIATNQFSFQPNYDWSDNGYIFAGYSVTNGIRIKVNEVSTVGAVLNLLVDAGASRIHSVGFGSSSLSTVRRQALERATEDALEKAQILANSTGVTLGRVVQVQLLSNSSVLNATQTEAVSFASDVPTSPGQNTYTETVNITYLIAE